MRSIDAKSTIGLICLIGLMGLSGCSSGQLPEPVAEQQIPVSFSGQQGDLQAATRATTSLQETGVSSFKVWGYKNMSYDGGTSTYGGLQNVFPAYTVNWIANSAATTTTNSHEWEYVGINGQTIKYWDFSAKAYRFFAVTGASVVSGQDLSEETYGSYTAVIPADVTDGASTPYYSHLWFSTGELPTYSDKQFGRPVTLEFVQPFTRVRFQFIYVYPREGIVLTNKSFKPTDDSDIARNGTVTISFPLKGETTKETLVSMAPDGVDPKALDEFTEDYDPENYSKVYTETDDGWYIVLPNATQDSYTLSVDVNGITRHATVPAQFMKWLPGYQYTYVFKIMEEGGVEFDLVSSAFTPWTELELSHELYNW